MDKIALIQNFWQDVAKQNAANLASYFTPEAQVCWHNTNESFTAAEYIRANCEYPGAWAAEIERIEQLDSLIITVARVFLTDQSATFHATSFFRFSDSKIAQLDEYWGDDGAAPLWRQEKKIGKPIK